MNVRANGLDTGLYLASYERPFCFEVALDGPDKLQSMDFSTQLEGLTEDEKSNLYQACGDDQDRLVREFELSEKQQYSRWKESQWRT